MPQNHCGWFCGIIIHFHFEIESVSGNMKKLLFTIIAFLLELYAVNRQYYSGGWERKWILWLLTLLLLGTQAAFQYLVTNRNKKYGAVLGCLFGFALTFGRLIHADEMGQIFCGQMRPWEFLGCFLGLSILWTQIFSLLYEFFVGESVEIKQERGRLGFFRNFLMIIPFYVLCFLAYFPGCMSYDSGYITYQAMRIIGFDNHHPFLHTLLWSFFAHMDDIGIILYTLFQVLTMTMLCAYVLCWIERRNIEGWKKNICRLFYGLNPVFHVFTLILAKDILFSGCLLWFTVTMLDFFEALSEGKRIDKMSGRLLFSTLLCCLLRNNMIYAVLVWMIILLAVLKKRFFLCKSIVGAVLLFYFITEVVYPSVGVAKGSIKEMLPVPMSQIAAVCRYKPEGISPEEWEMVKKYIPDVESYDKYYADYIKHNFNGDAFRENPKEFINLWFALFVREPEIYLESFLSLNLPYWYTGMESVRDYIETGNVSQDYPVQWAMWLPEVFQFYEQVAHKQAFFMKWTGISWIFSIGVPIWFFLFCLLGMRKHCNYYGMLALLPGGLLWMTYLLGPVSNFRYVEPLMLLYPVWFTAAAKLQE